MLVKSGGEYPWPGKINIRKNITAAFLFISRLFPLYQTRETYKKLRCLTVHQTFFGFNIFENYILKGKNIYIYFICPKETRTFHKYLQVCKDNIIFSNGIIYTLQKGF